MNDDHSLQFSSNVTPSKNEAKTLTFNSSEGSQAPFLKIEAFRCQTGETREAFSNVNPLQMHQILKASQKVIEDALKQQETSQLTKPSSGESTPNVQINSNIELSVSENCLHAKTAAMNDEILTAYTSVKSYNIIRDPLFRPDSQHKILPMPKMIDMNEYKEIKKSRNPLKINLKINPNGLKSKFNSAPSSHRNHFFQESQLQQVYENHDTREVSVLEFAKAIKEHQNQLFAAIENIRKVDPDIARRIEISIRGAERGDNSAIAELFLLARIDPAFSLIFEELVKEVVIRIRNIENGIGSPSESDSSDTHFKKTGLKGVEMEFLSEKVMRLPKMVGPEINKTSESVRKLKRPLPQNIEFESSSSTTRKTNLITKEYEIELLRFLKVPKPEVIISKSEHIDLMLSKPSPEEKLKQELASYQKNIEQGLVMENCTETDLRNSLLDSSNTKNEVVMTDPLPPFTLHSRIVSFKTEIHNYESLLARQKEEGYQGSFNIKQIKHTSLNRQVPSQTALTDQEDHNFSSSARMKPVVPIMGVEARSQIVDFRKDSSQVKSSQQIKEHSYSNSKNPSFDAVSLNFSQNLTSSSQSYLINPNSNQKISSRSWAKNLEVPFDSVATRTLNAISEATGEDGSIRISTGQHEVRLPENTRLDSMTPGFERLNFDLNFPARLERESNRLRIAKSQNPPEKKDWSSQLNIDRSASKRRIRIEDFDLRKL